MGRIKVKVTQTGGSDDSILVKATPTGGSGDSILSGVGPLTVTLTAEDALSGGTLPASTSVSLTVNGQLVGSQNTPSGRNAIDNLSYSFSQGAIGLSYSVSISGVDSSQIDYDPTPPTVQRSSVAEAQMSRKVEVPAPAGDSVSFFQRIILFVRGLFGLKPS